jgi:hypothetical protein
MDYMETPLEDIVFNVSPDVIDSIKIEASNLSPQKEKEIEDLSQVIGNKFIELYGEFMSPEKQAMIKEIPHKILVLPSEGFIGYQKAWMKEKTVNNPSTQGYFTIMGNIIVVDENKAQIKSERMSRFGAKETDILSGVIAHEAAHFLENQDLSLMFKELGASFYAKNILSKLNKWNLVSRNDLRRVLIYKKLVEKIGTNVHEVFFGKDTTDESKYKIYGYLYNIRDELDKIFR